MIGYCNDIITTSQQSLEKGKSKLNLKIQNAVSSDFETVEVSFDVNFLQKESNRMLSVDSTNRLNHVCLLMKQVELSIRRVSCFPSGVLSTNQFIADG